MKRSLCTYVVLSAFVFTWMVAPAQATLIFDDTDINNLTLTHEIVHATHESDWEDARLSWDNARFRQLTGGTLEPRFIQPNNPSGARTNYSEFVLSYDFSDLSAGGPTNVVLSDKLFFAAFTTDGNGNAINSQTMTVLYREGTSGAWTEARTLVSDGSAVAESNLTYSIALNSPDVFQYRVVYTVQGDANSVFTSDGQGLRWGFVRNNDANLTAFSAEFQMIPEPNTAMMLLLGGVGMLFGLRQRMRA